MADELVFKIGLSPRDVMEMDLSEVLYWHGRARLFLEAEHQRQKMRQP